MMINTRSAAAFSITRLRAIQSGKQKSLAKPTFQNRISADMPCTLFRRQFRPPICPCTEIHHPQPLEKAAYVGLSSSSIEWIGGGVHDRGCRAELHYCGCIVCLPVCPSVCLYVWSESRHFYDPSLEKSYRTKRHPTVTRLPIQLLLLNTIM